MKLLKRLLIILPIIIILGLVGVYFFNQYWIHQYDALIKRHAEIYRLDPALVWNVMYEETYFRSWQIGDDGEVGLMQVTPAVARAWAAETGMRDIEQQLTNDTVSFLKDPERNIQIGCWYLEKLYEQYRDLPEPEPRMLAAYNAGPSRVAEWSKVQQGAKPLTTEEFISRIDIPSTRAYVTSILARYKKKGFKFQVSS
jgi:soluble lytic murein transglycosylase